MIRNKIQKERFAKNSFQKENGIRYLQIGPTSKRLSKEQQDVVPSVATTWRIQRQPFNLSCVSYCCNFHKHNHCQGLAQDLELGAQ